MKKIESTTAKKAVTKAVPAKPVVGKVIAKAEPKVQPKVEPKAIVEAKRPEIPADFCLDKADWDSNTTCYDPNSNNCKACKKDFPKTTAACIARAEFLAVTVKESKARKASAGDRGSRAGKPTQVKIIDDGLLAKQSKDVIITALAKAHYGGEADGSKSLSTKRFDRHLKSIKDGSYVNSAKFADIISYLDKKPVVAKPAPVAAKK